MKRIRVAHVITKLELGGAQDNTLYTVAHLDPSRFETHLVCGSGGMLDEEAARIPNVAVHFCSHLHREIRPLSETAAFGQLKELFLKIRPDIVHTHSSKAGVLGRFAAKSAGVPAVIHTYHGFGFHRFQNPLMFRLYLAAERRACRRTDHLVFVSKDNWKWAEQLGLTRSCGASLIRSGIHSSEILAAKRNPDFRQLLRIPQEARIAGMVACLKPQKDPVTYVKAAAAVAGRHPDTHFVLAGDGELRDAVLSQTGAIPGGRFHFLGWRRDVHQILQELDVLVLTSLWEGLPRVLPEAILSGVPVVASDIDGNREVVEQTGGGMLARPRDAGDFAEKIIELLGKRERVAESARQAVLSEFNIDAMIEQQQDLYEGLAPKE